MTEQEFEKAKKKVLSRIIMQLEDLDRSPTEAEFCAVAEKVKQRLLPELREDHGINISDDDYKEILRGIRANITVQMEGEDAVIEGGDEHKKWLNSVKSKINWAFWTRYEMYLLLDKKWPPVLTAALNTTTNRILDLMGNPNSDENFSRRGLIIGEVQSGKTATYTALCAKAADAGYKVIIVLTGMLEDLRRQTQARLDLEFTGRDSSGSKGALANSIGVAKRLKAPFIQQLTSVDSDFDNSKVTTAAGTIDLKGMPHTVLLVVKKNKSVLENLIKWLKASIKASEIQKIKHPLLLLDDEADNASINTNDPDQEPTAINACIREMLKLFSQTTYIGVTATPFANIFINPFNAEGMFSDDLFPKDFIYALDVPNNYIGAEKIFGNDGEYKNFLVTIQPDDFPDVEEIFPKKHKTSLRVNELPESLCEAINYFLLVNAIRDLRRDEKTHRSMLINVSGWTDVHKQIYNLVNVFLDDVVRDLRAYAAKSSDEAEKNSAHIAALHKVFDKFDLEKLGGVPWQKLLRDNLRDAVEPVIVGLRNVTKEHPFSYEQNPDGLRVIAIGGYSFSRGLTLEGLCVTYFYRNSRNYDTLMQMGRWFGYRPNYGDLCRLWTTQEIVDWYGFIADVSKELKNEIAFMNAEGKTPKDFGLRVRRHPDTLEITAQNKRRFAQNTLVPVGLNKVFIETPQFENDSEILSANKDLILKFIDGLKAFPSPEKNFWRDVPKNLVAGLILNFKADSWQHNFQSQPVSEYISGKMDDKPWDIFIPEGDGDELIIDGKPIKPLVRTILVDSDNQIKIGASKRRIGRTGAVQKGLTNEQVKAVEKSFHSIKGNEKKSVPDNFYMIHDRRPILVLYVIQPISKSQNAANVPKVLFALGVGFPAASPNDSETNIQTAEFVINAIGAVNGDGSSIAINQTFDEDEGDFEDGDDD